MPEVPTILGRLADRYAKVAVISGRPLKYLTKHLQPSSGRTELVGLYGLERSPENGDPSAELWQPIIDSVADDAERSAPQDLRIERKGLAVTLHYREAPRLGGWAESFAREAATRSGLVAHAGKMSWELRPPVSTDKGSVVAELASGLNAVLYVGDDVGDIPAFAQLRRLEHTSRLAVAVASAETPRELIEAADLVVNGPHGVADLLSLLLRAG